METTSATNSSPDDDQDPSEMPAASQNTPFLHRRPARRMPDQILDVINVPEDQLPPTLLNRPRITSRDGKAYILEKWEKRKRPRASWVSDYGYWLVQVENNELKESWWCCSRCFDTVYHAGSTSNPATHLASKHNVHKDAVDQKDEPPRKKQASVLALQQQAASSRSGGTGVTDSQAVRFKSAFLNWLVASDSSFSVVQNPDFRAMLCILDPQLTSELLPRSGQTVNNWVDERYEIEVANLRKELDNAFPVRKHISFDLWTSPNSHALLAIVVHFVDQFGALQARLLALSPVRGSHSGENVAPIIEKAIERFGLLDAICYLQTDNAESNDTCIFHLFERIYSSESTAQIYHRVATQRARCIGHIINLVAKAFLEGNNQKLLKSLTADSERWRSLQEEEIQLQRWRSSGPIGKLHNVVKFVRASPQRRKEFSKITHGVISEEELDRFGLTDSAYAGLQLLADNATRWNSVYSMIERALKLRDAIDVYTNRTLTEKDPKKQIPHADVLTVEDWAVLVSIRDILKPFHRYTKQLEGHKAAFASVMPTGYHILDTLRQARDAYRGLAPPESNIVVADPDLPRLASRRSPSQPPDLLVDPRLGPGGFNAIDVSLTKAIAKLDKYLDLMEETPIYWAATVLHPGYRKRLVNKYLEPERAAQVFYDVERFVAGEMARLRPQEIPVESEVPVNTGPDLTPFHYHLLGPDFYEEAAVAPVDEYATFIAELPQYCEDPVGWWLSQKSRFPQLHQVAVELLSIPAMSDECERVFSTEKLSISSQRHRLLEEKIGRLVFTKCMMRSRRF